MLLNTHMMEIKTNVNAAKIVAGMKVAGTSRSKSSQLSADCTQDASTEVRAAMGNPEAGHPQGENQKLTKIPTYHN